MQSEKAKIQPGYKVNPYVFVLIREGGYVLWDYHNHHQWEVDLTYVEALGSLSADRPVDQVLLAEFIEAKLVVSSDCFPMEWGWDPVSQIYHLSSSNIFEDIKKSPDQLIEEYLAVCEDLEAPEVNMRPCEILFENIIPADLDYVSLARVLNDRKTSRSFDGRAVSFEQLAGILYTSCGEIHGYWPDLEDAGLVMVTKRRSFPSGGALYPIRYFVLVMNVTGISRGIYEYCPEQNGLWRVKEFGEKDFTEELVDCLCSQFFCEGLAAGLFFVPHFSKEWDKYPHSRSYRDVFLDIAHCSQNTLLVATGLGIQTWMTAAFKDEKLRNFLGIQEPHTYPVEFIGFGYGDNHSLPQRVREKPA